MSLQAQREVEQKRLEKENAEVAKKNLENQYQKWERLSKGTSINYTRNNPVYVDYKLKDKIDYGFYVTRYNVEKNKSFAQGTDEVKGLWKDGNFNWLAGFDLIRSPERLREILTFLSFGSIVLLAFVLLIVLIINYIWKSLFQQVILEPMKRNVWIAVIIVLCLIMLLTMLIGHIYSKVVDNIEILQYSIK